VKVEVVYATPWRQDIVGVVLAPGATVGEALERSGLRQRHPELRAGTARLGVHGRAVAPAYTLREGDRVEVLRPLPADPKELRRRRARRR